MIKYLFVLMLLFFVHCANAQTEKGASIEKGPSFDYFKISADADGNKLIIFLHGSVKYFLNTNISEVRLNELLEGNKDFCTTFSDYDIIVPFVNRNFNWLDSNCVGMIEEQILTGNRYDTVILAGFSDGGTGVYKMFYKRPELFDGLAIFNGYPQHRWASKAVDYAKVNGKVVLFFSSNRDKVIPYEFLLAEYRKQAIYNANTIFKLTEGGHQFAVYGTKDFNLINTSINQSSSTDREALYAPIDGLMIGDTLLEVYEFRNRIGKNYGFNSIYLGQGFTKMECRRLNRKLRQQTGQISNRLSLLKQTNKGECKSWEVPLKVGKTETMINVPDYRCLKIF